MSVIDNAVYVEGRRHLEPPSLEVTYGLLREQKGMAWIGLYRPDADEVASVAAEFEIHELAVEDTITAHQRPKLERYGEVLFTVLRPARYLEASAGCATSRTTSSAWSSARTASGYSCRTSSP